MAIVVYTAKFSIETRANEERMAIHEAGGQWPEFEQTIQGIGGDIEILSIEFKADPDATSHMGAMSGE
jgi:hypothetical protein